MHSLSRQETLTKWGRKHPFLLLAVLVVNVLLFILVVQRRFKDTAPSPPTSTRRIIPQFESAAILINDSAVHAVHRLKADLEDLRTLSNISEAQYKRLGDSVSEIDKAFLKLGEQMVITNNNNGYDAKRFREQRGSQVKSRIINVVVLASMRTGSSFIGEMLNSHPKILYAFEPTKHLNLQDGSPTLSFRAANQLRDFYTCNFSSPDLKMFLDFYNSLPPRPRFDYVKAWVNADNCKSNWNGGGWGWCKTITVDEAKQSCLKFDIRAAKVIRIGSMNVLTHLMDDPEINLRVVNVVRDPRGMMSSVMPLHLHNYEVISKRIADRLLSVDHFHKFPALAQRCRSYCDNMLNNFLLSQQDWFPGDKYLVVRYEDAAYDPHGTAKKISTFLGISVHDNVLRWLDRNTNGGENKKDENYIYNTRRDSRATAQNWKRKMTFDLVTAIQSTGSCTTLMDIMGYRIVKTPAELLNQSLSMVLPRE